MISSGLLPQSSLVSLNSPSTLSESTAWLPPGKELVSCSWWRSSQGDASSSSMGGSCLLLLHCTQGHSSGTRDSMRGAPSSLFLIWGMSRQSWVRSKEGKDRWKTGTNTWERNLQAPCLHHSSVSPATLKWQRVPLGHYPKASGLVSASLSWRCRNETPSCISEKSALNHSKRSS